MAGALTITTCGVAVHKFFGDLTENQCISGAHVPRPGLQLAAGARKTHAG